LASSGRAGADDALVYDAAHGKETVFCLKYFKICQPQLDGNAAASGTTVVSD